MHNQHRPASRRRRWPAGPVSSLLVAFMCATGNAGPLGNGGKSLLGDPVPRCNTPPLSWKLSRRIPTVVIHQEGSNEYDTSTTRHNNDNTQPPLVAQCERIATAMRTPRAYTSSAFGRRSHGVNNKPGAGRRALRPDWRPRTGMLYAATTPSPLPSGRRPKSGLRLHLHSITDRQGRLSCLT